MAIFKSIFQANMRGTLGNMYTRSSKDSAGKTRTVVAVKPTNVTNPRTYSQQVQRAKFANAVKFYKRATQKFFKFAFEDKKGNESDYNAFMRHNVAASLVLNKDLVNTPEYPALGNKWQLSFGSLTQPFTIVSNAAGIFQMYLKGTFSNVSELSSILLGYGLQEGDYVTIPVIGSQFAKYEADLAGADDGYQVPLWQIFQFRIDTNSDVEFKDIPYMGVPFATLSTEIRGTDLDEGAISISVNKLIVNPGLQTIWAGLVISRDMGGNKVMATSSYLYGDKNVDYMIETAATDQNFTDAVTSWGYTGGVILQGSIVGGETNSSNSDSGSSSSIVVTSVNGATPPVAAKGADVKGDALTITIVGTGLAARKLTLTGWLANYTGYEASAATLNADKTQLVYKLTAPQGVDWSDSADAASVSYNGSVIMSWS